MNAKATTMSKTMLQNERRSKKRKQDLIGNDQSPYSTCLTWLCSD
jgi:hypothetical protein